MIETMEMLVYSIDHSVLHYQGILRFDCILGRGGGGAVQKKKLLKGTDNPRYNGCFLYTVHLCVQNCVILTGYWNGI